MHKLKRIQFLELDKSSSDVAAEGAILNEMLEIVAKRAALRASDAAGQQQNGNNGCGSSSNRLESDVSSSCFDKILRCISNHLPCREYHNWLIVSIEFFIIYACILYFALTR